MSNASNQTQPSPLLLEHETQILRRRILWLMGVRLLCSTLLMGGTVIFQLQGIRGKAHPTENFVFWLVGGTYFLTLLYSFVFPRIRQMQRFGALQLACDVLIVSLLVIATGSQDSLFLFSYLLVIIGAAFVLYRRGAFLFAVASLVMLAVVLFGTMFEGVRSLSFVRVSVLLKPPELLYILVMHAPAFFLIAFLSSHLVEQIRHTGEILKQQQIDFDNLEALHKDIIGSLTSGLIAGDLSARIQFYNAFAGELLGISGDELLGRHIDEIIPGVGDLWMERQAQMPRRHKRVEIPYRHPNGQDMILGCGIVGLHSAENKEIGSLILFQDLTPIKQIEEQVKAREKLASIGSMAAGLAHEIRNPLSSLSGAVQLLQSELDLRDEDQILMNIVVQEADRLNRLLTDFLMFARPKAIQKRRCELLTLLKETVYLFKLNGQYEGVTIDVPIESGCTVDVDPQLLHQILWNLLHNSAQAMQPDGGIIVINAKMDQEGTRLLITDEGGGIDPERKEQIFDPFFSTKEGGTGLGLAVVRRLVSAHDGYIILADTLPGQTCFEMFFPHGDSVLDEASLRPPGSSGSIEIEIHERASTDSLEAAPSMETVAQKYTPAPSTKAPKEQSERG